SMEPRPLRRDRHRHQAQRPLVPRGLADRPRGAGAALLHRAAQGPGRVLPGDAGREDEDHRRGRAVRGGAGRPAAPRGRRRDAGRGEGGGGTVRFLTNVGDEGEAGPENPIRVEMNAATGEPHPYLHVRRGLEALIARPVFYELVEMAEERPSPDGPRLEVASN